MELAIKDVVTIAMSAVSLILSGFALWVAQFSRGQIQMSHPTLICLKREQPRGTPKLFLRTLLFTTGTKGRVVENMFVKVHQKSGIYIFCFWGHTEGGKLTLGSGLSVSSAGTVCDHHFNPPGDGKDFMFIDGEYKIEVFATIFGRKKPKKLAELFFTVSGEQAAELIQIPSRELYLLWHPESQRYESEIRRD